jgi:hypothetical protein
MDLSLAIVTTINFLGEIMESGTNFTRKSFWHAHA